MGFNVEGARQAGYSDPEIAAHLAEDQGFDLDGARAAGYQDAEIIGELAPAVGLTWSQRVGEKLFGNDGKNGQYATGALTSLKDTVTGMGRPDSTLAWKDVPGATAEAVKRVFAKTVAGAKLEVLEMGRGAWARPGVAEAMPMQSRNALQNSDAQDTIDRERQIIAEITADDQALADKNPSFAQQTVIGAGQSVAAAGPAIAAGIATKNPAIAAGMLYPTTQPLAYAEARQQGIEPNKAQKIAHLKAAVEVGTELLPAKELFKVGTPGFKRLIGFLSAEIPGESIATLSETMVDYLAQLPDAVTGQDIIDGLAEGVSQLPQTVATTVAAGGAQVALVQSLNNTSSAVERRMEARRQRLASIRAPGVTAPPITEPPPPSIPGNPPPEDGNTGIPPEQPPAPPPAPPVEEPPAPPADTPPATPPIAPPPVEVPPEAPPAVPPETGQANPPAGAEVPVPPAEVAPPATPKWAEDQVPTQEPTYRATNPETGMEAQVRPTQNGGFAVALHDLDSGKYVSQVTTFPDEARARQYAHEIAQVPEQGPTAGTTPPKAPAFPLAERIATDADLRADLEDLNTRAGWSERGGRGISAGNLDERGNAPDINGRTIWGARETWWSERPPGLTEATLDAAVKRALAGKKLGSKQQEAIRFLVTVADERRGRYDEIVPEDARITPDEVTEYENPTTVNIGQLAQMASQYVDEDIIEQALEAQTDAEAIRRLEAILKEHGHGLEKPHADEVGAGGSETAPGEAEGPGRLSAQRAGGDLFGGSDRSGLNEKNAKVARKLGEGRGPVPADNAPPGDIFRDAADKAAAKVQGTQADLEDEADLPSNARPADSKLDAAKALGNGDRVFVAHEMDNSVTEIRDESILENFPVDQIYIAPRDDAIQAMAAGPGRVQKATWNPGGAFVPNYQSPGGGAPAAPVPTISLGTAATGTQRDVKQAEEPVRREHIMSLFQKELGLKIYQGKPFKVRGALGFFRPSTFEIRNKNQNDLEVAAHEVFHWIDRTYPTLRKLYHQKRFDTELRGISYDANKLEEGFAEFGRLFMTRETDAVAAAPTFYEAFVAEAKAVGIYGKLSRVQEQMHKWYLQGADSRARSKIGEVPPPVSAQIRGFLDGWGDRAAMQSVDYLHAAKVIERETQGGIARDAVNSPYKSLRLLAGARATANTFLNHGTLGIAANGEFEFTGPGLRQIFEPIGNEIDDAMAYFVGRRAQELKRHGKENLFSKDEIEALLARGLNNRRSKEIVKAFQDYQDYTERLLDFAEAAGIVSAETRAVWRQMYQNYVPFYRVAESLGGDAVSSQNPAMVKPGAVFKRLRGGTSNLRDIWENLSLNTATVVHASLKNMAKRQLYSQIQRSPLGQKYAVKIATDTHAVPVAMTQVENVLRSMVQEAQARATDPNATAADKAHYHQVAMALDLLTGATNAAGGAALEDIQSQATFFTHNHPPTIPDKDSILINGKRVWFQIGDPLLWNMLSEINFFKPLGVAEQALGLAKRVLTRGVTLTPEFQIANLIRDGYNAFTMSKGGQLPLVDSLRAFRDIWTESEAYKLYLANGGGFGNAISDEAARVKLRLHRFDRHHLLDAPAKLVDFWDKWGQSFELATRLAEFKKMRAKGASAREAAFQGREISSDFAMRGRSQIAQLAITSLPFFGARLQGLYRLERELFERKGRQSWTGERALAYATRSLLALTLPSLMLYAINGEDEDYKALPDETKNLFWPVKMWWGEPLTGKARFLLIPKPFETGALFATIPERMWQAMTEGKPKALVDAALFTLMNTFAFDPNPQLVKPLIDVFYRNRYWTGAPIVPRSLENVEPAEQYRPWTAKSMVEIGEAFNVSPLKLEALVNGYLGTVGQWSLMAADSLVSTDTTGEDPTRRMSQYPVFRRFLREQPFSNTAYEKRFYELADEVTVTVQTMAKLRREAKADKIERYLGESEKAQLFVLGGIAKKIQDKSRDLDAAMRSIKTSPFLTADQKRQQMDELQAQQNKLFKEAVTALDTPTLEKYRDALEGKP